MCTKNNTLVLTIKSHLIRLVVLFTSYNVIWKKNKGRVFIFMFLNRSSHSINWLETTPSVPADKWISYLSLFYCYTSAPFWNTWHNFISIEIRRFPIIHEHTAKSRSAHVPTIKGGWGDAFGQVSKTCTHGIRWHVRNITSLSTKNLNFN